MTPNQFLAILYADIFDFPLTGKEYVKWEIKNQKLKRRSQKKNLKIKILKLIEEKNGLYFLKGREKILELRKKRERYSAEKLKIAQKIAGLLKIIPTVKMVALTGAVAIKNADKNDDIDFLVVTSSRTLWLTRFLTTLGVELTGKRRHPKERIIKDKICLNMFIDEGYLEIPEGERNLYTAHEAAQLIPLWDRDNTYFKFLSKNKWVRDYLPRAVESKKYEVLSIKYEKQKKRFFLIEALEKLFRNFQLWHMKKRRTREKISEGRIKFHPEDKTEFVLKEYNKRVEKYLHTNLS